MNRLVSTAKTPETEMACPACPSVMWRSEAIGVRRLTGMNSEATSTVQHSAIARTAPHAGERSSIVSLVEAIPIVIMASELGWSLRANPDRRKERAAVPCEFRVGDQRATALRTEPNIGGPPWAD